MINIFEEMIGTAKKLGVVTDANMYDYNFMTVNGKTKDGTAFTLTLNIKEENKDVE